MLCLPSYDSERTELINERTELKTDVSRLNAEVGSLTRELGTMHTAHGSEIQRLREDHIIAIQQLREDHRHAANQREGSHNIALQQLREDHNIAIQQLREDHRHATEDLRAENRDLRKKLRHIASEHEGEMEHQQRTVENLRGMLSMYQQQWRGIVLEASYKDTSVYIRITNHLGTIAKLNGCFIDEKETATLYTREELDAVGDMETVHVLPELPVMLCPGASVALMHATGAPGLGERCKLQLPERLVRIVYSDEMERHEFMSAWYVDEEVESAV